MAAPVRQIVGKWRAEMLTAGKASSRVRRMQQLFGRQNNYLALHFLASLSDARQGYMPLSCTHKVHIKIAITSHPQQAESWVAHGPHEKKSSFLPP